MIKEQLAIYDDRKEQLAIAINKKVRDKTGVEPVSITVMLGVLSVMFSALRLYCQWKANRAQKQQQENNTSPTPNENTPINPNSINKDLKVEGGFLAKRRARRAVKSQLTPTQYREYGDVIVDSIFEVGIETPSNELADIINSQSV